MIAAFCLRRGVVELAIFGSTAKGEATAGSDLDVLVTFAPGVVYDLDDRDAMEAELTRILGRAVDFVPRHAVTNPFILREIEQSKRVIYAA